MSTTPVKPAAATPAPAPSTSSTVVSTIGSAVEIALQAASSVNPIIAIAAAAEPAIVGLINAIKALRTKYPSLTADQIVAVVAQITVTADAAFDDALQTIAADKAAHPGG